MPRPSHLMAGDQAKLVDSPATDPLASESVGAIPDQRAAAWIRAQPSAQLDEPIDTTGTAGAHQQLEQLLFGSYTGATSRQDILNLGPEIAPQLSAIALNRPNYAVGCEAFELLIELDPQAAARVAERTFSDPTRYKNYVLTAAQYVRDTRGIEGQEALLSAFLDKRIEEGARAQIADWITEPVTASHRGQLLDILESESDSNLRLGAATLLYMSGLFDEEARDVLRMTIAADPGGSLQSDLVWILTQLPFCDSFEALASLVQDPNASSLRPQACLGLIFNAAAQGRQADAAEVMRNFLAQPLEDHDAVLYMEVSLPSIGLFGAQIAGPLLQEFLKRDDLPIDLRAQAITTLSASDPSSALTLLEPLLTGKHDRAETSTIRSCVSTVVANAGGLAKAAILTGDLELCRELREVLLRSLHSKDRQSAPDSVFKAGALLLSSDRDEALSRIHAKLKEYEQNSDLRAIDQVLGNPDPRIAALRAIQGLDDPKVMPLVETALKSSSLMVQLAACEVLLEYDKRRAGGVICGLQPSTLEHKAELARLQIMLGSPDAAQEVFTRFLDAAPSWDMAHRVGSALDTPARIEQFALNLEEASHRAPDAASGSRMLTYACALQRSLELGINSPLRFRPDDLAQIVDNRSNPQPATREAPLAVVVLPREDHNGAFYQAAGPVSDLIERGYEVKIFEAANEEDVADALRAATAWNGNTCGDPAALIVLGAHGFKQGMAFGAADPQRSISNVEELSLGLEDREQLAALAPCLKAGGNIVLWSCSTGAGAGEELDRENVANMLRDAFPHAAPGGILAPWAPSRVGDFRFDAKNRVRDYRFSVPTYHAWLESAERKESAA